jgi:4-amino-4-deoxy-L-arabinose transferase-like glycosyltransferase
MVLSAAYRYIILTLVAGVILFLSLNPLPRSYFGPTADEGYYFRYASSVVHNGKPAFSGLISWYASSDKARLHPAPARVGYILLCAFLFKFSEHPSIALLAFISTISFFLFLYICFHYVRKYFDLDTALLTVLLLVSSPLMMGLSRRALVDSPLNLLWALTVWLFLDVLLKQNRFSYFCFLVSLLVAITFKETSLILIPFFVMAGILGRRQGAVINIPQILGIIICPLIFMVLFYGWIYGGVGPLKTAVMAIAKTHFSSGQSNPYAINYSSGPWFRYLLDFLLITPVVTLLFIGYTGYLCIQRKALDFNKTYFLLYFVYVYGVLSCLAHSKVVRFVVNLEMVMGLFAVLMLVEVVKGLHVRKKQFFVFYFAFGIFVYNWFSFMDLFYKPSLLDPISYHLLVLRHFIPG